MILIDLIYSWGISIEELIDIHKINFLSIRIPIHKPIPIICDAHIFVIKDIEYFTTKHKLRFI